MDDLGTNRILIVEDSLLNQAKLKRLFGASYELRIAGTAAEAISLINEFEPHLILLDIILPDGNGFDILEMLQASNETVQIPVIVISGLDSVEDEERGFKCGAVDYIRKPFRDAIVIARVNMHIRIINQVRAMERLCLVDSLTGVYNRRVFDDKVRHEWARCQRRGGCMSILMIDVDNFKLYNDSYGHPQGDLMLQSVARTIQATLMRTTDICCRYGGEEFVCLLPDTDSEGAAIVAERIRTKIEAMTVLNAETNQLTQATASIGIATGHSGSSLSVQELTNAADKMLYKAKKSGRNRVESLDLKPVSVNVL